MELFGRSLTLAEFPILKSIRGLGMTDQECYAKFLEQKFDYTNTFYDREPRLDFTEPHPELEGTCDFILSADVLEHIAPPVERSLERVAKLLKPYGFFGVTIFCNPQNEMREHFPELHEYRIVRLGNATVVVNRRRDGPIEVHENPIFHGGSGSTLEMREFGISALEAMLRQAGFCEIRFLTENVPEAGILFDHDVSQPLIASKGPFTLSPRAVGELVDELRLARRIAEKESDRAATLARHISLASESRWLKLGRKIGVGPRFD